MKQRFVVVDLETTGNSPKKGDRIIQIAAVVIENEEIIDQYTTFVNPCVPIPSFIEELTGINDDMVKHAPLFEEVAPELTRILKDSIFVAHNVLFDLNFLQSEFNRVGCPEFVGLNVDTVELAKVLLPTSDSYKLFELTECLAIKHDRPHQADSDALVTAELLLQFINQTRELPLVTLEKLAKLSIGLKSNLNEIFEDILTEKRNHLENLSEHLEVFKGIALRKKNKKYSDHNYREKKEYPLHHHDKQKLLSNGIKHYEVRDGQHEMMDTVYEAFRLNKHAMIEAGTGIGKSIAYLLPSIYFSKTENQPILISTHTIQLQDQLLNTELKKLEKVLSFPFKAVVLKGKQHYINLFKFEQTLYEADQQYDTILTKMQLLVWLIHTETGDIDEVNLSSGGKIFWNRIRHDGWHLSKERDPWIAKDFYLYARREAENADIVITNHSMLLLDLIQKQQLFKDFNYVVLDEAHHFEKTSRGFLGEKLEYIPSKFFCSQLGSYEKQQLFYQLELMVQKQKISLKMPTFELDFIIAELETEIDELFTIIAEKLLKNEKKNKGHHKLQIRLSNKLMKEKALQPILFAAERVISSINQIRSGLEERLSQLKKISEKLSEKDKALLEEVFSYDHELVSFKHSIQHLLLEQTNEFVYWLEGDMRAIPNSISIQAQPISVSEKLSKEFFAKRKSVILTSATLTVKDSFRFFENELGLHQFEDLIKKQIPSPFPYSEMTKLLIPNDIPEIREVAVSEYVEAIANHLIAIAQATKGRMLVLFTSYDMLKKTYELMKESGLLDDFILIAQGITTGSRMRLTKNFQRFDKAVLFGTNSFWEGVDIPGEDLSCLSIVRLPFSPPDEPYTWAKNEAIQAEGKNPFSTYSLPEAVIRFKQGFGRLIRSSTDKGIVIVFDRRIETTSYGNAFIRSIPFVPIEHVSLKEMIETVEKWL